MTLGEASVTTGRAASGVPDEGRAFVPRLALTRGVIEGTERAGPDEPIGAPDAGAVPLVTANSRVIGAEPPATGETPSRCVARAATEGPAVAA